MICKSRGSPRQNSEPRWLNKNCSFFLTKIHHLKKETKEDNTAVCHRAQVGHPCPRTVVGTCGVTAATCPGRIPTLPGKHTASVGRGCRGSWLLLRASPALGCGGHHPDFSSGPPEEPDAKVRNCRPGVTWVANPTLLEVCTLPQGVLSLS